VQEEKGKGEHEQRLIIGERKKGLGHPAVLFRKGKKLTRPCPPHQKGGKGGGFLRGKKGTGDDAID